MFETERSYDKTKQEVVCKFEWPSKGKWIYSIINPFDHEFYVKLKVFVYFQRLEEMQSYYPNYYSNRNSQKRRVKKESENELNTHSSIKFDAKWSKKVIHYASDTQMIYASVSRNLQPVLNATVRAIIHRPTGDYITLELYDNGLNADRYAYDGVYTRYFSNFNANGVYFARVNIFFLLL